MKHPDTFHFPPVGEMPCNTYHPLDDHELHELRTQWLTSKDHYTRMSIARRVEQGIVGMTTPSPISGPVADGARKAVNWFVAWASGDESKLAQLQILLGITQPELLAA